MADHPQFVLERTVGDRKVFPEDGPTMNGKRRRGASSGLIRRNGGIGAGYRFDAYFAANAQMIVFGRFPSETMHAHRSIQLVAALDGPIRLLQADGSIVSSERLLIPPLLRHALLGYEGRLVLLNFDHRIRSVAATRMQPLTCDFTPDPSFMEGLQDLFVDGDGRLDAYDMMTRWIEDWVSGRAGPRTRIDARVDQAKRRIDDAGAASIDRVELARSVGLSPSRFAAIFAADTGTSLSRYLIGCRLHKALRLIGYGESVTAAAVAAGFSDGAHLARSSRAMLGIPPSRTIGIRVRRKDLSRWV